MLSRRLILTVMGGASVLVVSGCATYGPVDISKSGSHTQITAAQKTALSATLRRHSARGLFIAPNIPLGKINNARRTCAVPQDDEILGLVDATALGSAENCLLVSSSGVFFRNNWASDSPGRYFLPYGEFQDLVLDKKGLFEVSIGGVHLNLSGCSMSRDAVISLLRDIQKCGLGTSAGPVLAGTEDAPSLAGRSAEQEFSTSSPQTPKGIRPNVAYADPNGITVGEYSGSYALLVGVSKYTEGWLSLDAVPGEMNEIGEALKRNGFEVRKVMDPDGEALVKAFDNFIKDYGFDKNNRLLFFYSGHGYTLDNGERGYLVPADAPDPEKDEKGFRQKALDMTDILGWCRKMTAKHSLFLFDSCFSGTIFTTRGRPKQPSHITALTDKPVRQFVSAGTAGQQVPAKSVFAPCFLKALRGDADYDKDGFVTGTELGMYLFNSVTDYTDRTQTPQFGKIKDARLDEGDFVFSVHKSTTTARSLSSETATSPR